MSDGLTKIEEQHSDCYGCHPLENRKPCDVVKLARALEQAQRRLLLVVGTLETEFRREMVVQYSDDALGALEEVAGVRVP